MATTVAALPDTSAAADRNRSDDSLKSSSVKLLAVVFRIRYAPLPSAFGWFDCVTVPAWQVPPLRSVIAMASLLLVIFDQPAAL